MLLLWDIIQFIIHVSRGSLPYSVMSGVLTAFIGFQLNCKYTGERSIAIAMWVMFAISGLMVGTQLFQGSDAPHYNDGLLYMIILVTIGITLAAVQEAIYAIHNRNSDQGKGKVINGEPEPRVYVL